MIKLKHVINEATLIVKIYYKFQDNSNRQSSNSIINSNIQSLVIVIYNLYVEVTVIVIVTDFK